MLLFETDDWTFDGLKRAQEAISEIALKELNLDCYPNQIEIISSDQMLDAYSSNGLPIMYSHWSFGKRFIQDEYSYRKGLSGLAYEIVINSNPCISYLMEGNSSLMQMLVIGHAAFGHNHFFKNNYLFKQWTSADSIIDYMQFAKDYINKMEEEHGPDTVEDLLNALHSIQGFGIDRYKRPTKINKQQEEARQKQRAEYVQAQANILWSTLPSHIKDKEASIPDAGEEKKFPLEPQENILYFIEKHSPILEPWQREIVRIVRKVSQYYYPQMQTKLMNEGFASFVHYYIMNRLWETDQISNGQALEFLHSHSSVLTQLTHTSEYYSGFNPYALGFEMFSDIRRVCEEPTEVDKEYFPHMVGENWKEVMLDAVENYRDESFISQFLTPATVKKWKLFEITNKEQDPFVMVTSIQNRKDFNNVRQTLSQQYSIAQLMPTIEIIDANVATTRELHLKYTPYDNSELHECSEEVLQYIEQLWGYPIVIK